MPSRDGMTLRTELEVRRFVGLPQHARLRGSMGIMAVQAATLLHRVVDRGLVFEREGSAEFRVTLKTDIRAVEGQLTCRQIQ